LDECLVSAKASLIRYVPFSLSERDEELRLDLAGVSEIERKIAIGLP